jgi:hypothetical protein
MIEDLPELRTIRDPKHPVVSAGVCEDFSEAAEVSLARHHEPPRTMFSIDCCGEKTTRGLLWSLPNDTAQRAHNNRADATRDAAYIVSLAVVEKELGMVAIYRADIRTGADYYVGIPKADDLEEAFRLEVAGVGPGDVSAIKQTHKAKREQALRGDSSLPAFACVVGFSEAIVLLSRVEGN